MESSGRARICPSRLNPLAPVFVQSCTCASDEADAGSDLQCEGFGQLPDEVRCRPSDVDLHWKHPGY